MSKLRSVAVAVVAGLFSLTAQAAELPPLLESAILKGEEAEAHRWAFTQRFTIEDSDLTMRFEPMGEAGAWQLVAPEEATLDAEDAELYRRITDVEGDPKPDADLTYEQIRSALGDQTPEVIEETDARVVYGFAPLPWNDIDDEDEPILEHMRAEVTVEKDGAYISRIRLYAPESFRHMMVARIDRFEQEMVFAPEPSTGLPLMTSFLQEIEGSALFQRFNQARTEVYSDFVPMTGGGAVLSCGIPACSETSAATP